MREHTATIDIDGRDRRGPSVRRSARTSLVRTIRRIPDYLRLLFGMMRDRRVSSLDRGLVVAAIAYVISPLDVIPDVIPFLGQVDDVFLVVMTLTRLFERARSEVIFSHWPGDPAELSPRALRRLLLAASVFLPMSARRRLRALAKR